MQNQKTQKPTLTGQRIKTRKRDEKEKYDPITFRDQVVAGLNEGELDLDKASKFLIQAGSKLDLRRYAETLFDILISGGIFAPGGTVVDDNDELPNAGLCVFNTECEVAPMRLLVNEVFERIIRQYKYLEKSLDEEMKKVLQFLKGFNEDQRNRLAVGSYILITANLCTPTCLSKILNETLVKEGIAKEFARMFFKTWLSEKDFPSLLAALKKAELDGKLLDLFPLNKRSLKSFEEYFCDEDLKPVVEFQRNHVARTAIRELKAKLTRRFNEEEASTKEMIELCQDYEDRFKLGSDIIEIIWSQMMKSVEWNKKEDLLADQALKHIKANASILAEFTKTPTAELALLTKIQDYCYDNMNFMKVFQKIIMLLYKMDVIGEDTIVRWYNKDHSPKGKSVFLAQMQKMVEWLQNAEEESSDEEDEEDEEK